VKVSDESDHVARIPAWVWSIAAIAFVGLVLYELSAVITPILIGFFIAFLLDPVVDRFQARGLPRSVGVATVLTLALSLGVVFLLFAIPAMIRDFTGFLESLPELVVQLESFLDAQFGVTLPRSFAQAFTEFEIGIEQLTAALSPAGSVASWLLGGTASVIVAIGSAFLIPVLAAYLLHDFDHITSGIRDLVPARFRPFVVDIAHEINAVLGALVRGQMLIMVVLAVAYSVVYAALGVPLALFIGLAAGVLSFIPYVGSASALGLAVLSCLAHWNGWWQLIGVVIAHTVVQVFEGFFLTPRIVGETVGLAAVWVLIALLVGGELFGFMGVLLALPAAAVFKIFVLRALAWYRQTAFFKEGELDASTTNPWLEMLKVEGLPDDSMTSEQKLSVAQDTSDDDP